MRSYGGSFLGFSDFYSGNGDTKTTMTITATMLGGGAGSDYANWEGAYNSNQTPLFTGAVYEQSWTGTSSNGVLQGTSTQAPGGDGADGSTDTNLALVKMSKDERYSNVKIVVNTETREPGFSDFGFESDYIGFVGGE